MTTDQYWHIHRAACELANGYFGGFAEAIGTAMLRADSGNLQRLAEAFPDLIKRAHDFIAAEEAREAIRKAQETEAAK